MWKSTVTGVAAVVLALAVWLIALPPSGERTAAQSGALFINLVELDIVPAEIDKYLAAIKENGAASVKEPGCREFNIVVSTKDPHHVVLFEVYDSPAALDLHRTTDHFKKYQATTANMVAKREARAFSSVAMNTKGM